MHRPCALKVLNISRRFRIAITSRPLVGSSSITFAGSCTSARASAVLMRWPCEKPLARRSMKLSMSSARASSATRSASRLPPMPCSEPKYAMFSRAVKIPVQTRRVRQDAQVSSRGRGLAADVEAVDAGAPAVGREDPVEHSERRRLAGPVRSEEPRDRSIRGAERDLAHRLDGAETLAQRRGLDHGEGPVSPTKNGAG